VEKLHREVEENLSCEYIQATQCERWCPEKSWNAESQC